MKKNIILLVVFIVVFLSCEQPIDSISDHVLQDISNLQALSGNGEIILSWSNPQIEQFDYSLISFSH